jgi:hypothetical protein
MSWFNRRWRSSGAWVLAGAGVAAGAAIAAADPGRRGALASRARRALRDVEHLVDAGVRDLAHRGQGLAYEARAWLTPENASDEVLSERVRARLGHLTSHARAIRIAAQGGWVRLAGPVLVTERMQVLRGVRAVRGVRALEDALEPHDSADVRELEGSKARHPPAILLPPGSPAYRLLAGAAGVFLVGRALAARGLGRIPAGLFGATLLRSVIGDANAARADAARLALELREVAAHAARTAERAQAAAKPREGAQRAEVDAGPGEARVAAKPPVVRRVPEVREVKSPSELEPGVASASPDPLRPGRVDRRDLRGRPPARRAPPSDAPGEDTPDEHVSPHSRFIAPESGAGVREADLGTTLPRDEEPREPAPDDVPWGPSPDELFRRPGASADGEHDPREPRGDDR